MIETAYKRVITTGRLRRCAARVSPKLLIVLIAFGLSAGAVGYLLVERYASSDSDGRSESARPSAQAIADELGELQQALQAAMQEQRDLARLEARIRDFTRRHPEQSDGHVLQAQIQTRMQKWGPAYDALSRALAIKPDAVELSKMAGACAAKLDRLDTAKQHYKNAERAAGDAADSDIYAALGRIYLALGNDIEAEQAFNQSRQAPGPRGQDNYLHEARSGLADVAAYRGAFDQAHEQIDRAIRLAMADDSADLPAYQIQKARLYMDAGQDDDAVTMLALTWNEHPESRWRIESARLRAALYERAEALDKAVNHIALVCDFHQRDQQRVDLVVADFFALLARWQIKAGQTDAARLSLDNLRTLSPDHHEIEDIRRALR